MKVLNKQELTILAILAYPKIARAATEMLRSHINLFSSVQSPHVYLMWNEYLKLRKKHIGKKLSKSIVKAELAERIQENEDMPPELIERCDYILEKFGRNEDIPSVEESNELLQTMVKGDVNRKLSRQISNDADIQEMMRTMNSASDVISELEIEAKDDNQFIFNPFQEMDKLAVHMTRLPTGINWMDEITSGGGRGGELWLFLGGSGGGKCLAPDTPVLMYDGTVKQAKDVQIGDQLMGPDSTPRNVLQLGSGRTTMYKVIPVKGEPYVVNKDHILTVVVINKDKPFRYGGITYRKGDLVDIPVEDFIKLPKHTRASVVKGVRTGVEFHNDLQLPLDPYFVGLYLGDGTRRNAQLTLSDPVLIDYVRDYGSRMGWIVTSERYKDEDCWCIRVSRKSNRDQGVLPQVRSVIITGDEEKHIHDAYKRGSRETRLQLLAGLLDTDGYMHHGHYEISTKYDKLASDILFVARSLGYAAYDNYGQKTCCNTGATGMYHRITISGDFRDLPVRCERNKIGERKQIKNVLHTGLTVERLSEGAYCGFVIDGDHRFLLGDFTITHNTATAVQYACAQALMGNTTVWATYEQSLEGDISERIISYVTDESLDKIRDVGFNNLPEDIQRKFWASVSGTNDKLVVLDMTRMKREQEADPQDYGGIYSIWKQVKRLKEEGKQVRTVLVDWVGAMMLRVAANTGKDLTNGFRFYAQHEIDVARDMVKKENIQVIFFHQIDSKTAHMKPTYCPDMTCAKDMHDMSNYMDIVITLGRRDPNNVCWISSAKSRRGAPISRTIQLIGEKSRFVTAKGWIPNRDGNFYKPSDDYQPEGPQSTAPAGNAAFSREID